MSVVGNLWQSFKTNTGLDHYLAMEDKKKSWSDKVFPADRSHNLVVGLYVSGVYPHKDRPEILKAYKDAGIDANAPGDENTLFDVSARLRTHLDVLLSTREYCEHKHKFVTFGQLQELLTKYEALENAKGVEAFTEGYKALKPASGKYVPATENDEFIPVV
ncbi:MAG: hypothetical protein LRZ85_08600 [Alphaproteobacteria bacterium]|nr:hypothetical protein [Alphaproteobacteria bacterium]